MSTYAGNFLKNGVLTGIVQSFKPSDTLIAKDFFTPVRTLSDNFSFDVVSNSKGKLDFRNADSSAGVSSLLDRERKKVILATLREKRQLPESVLRWWSGAGKDVPEAGQQALARELEDLNYQLDRTWEYLMWQELTTGSVTLTGEDTQTYNFGTIGSATSSPTWATTATSTPLADLVGWKRTVEQNSGMPATDIYLSSQALEYLFESTSAQALLGDGTKDQYGMTGVIPNIAGMKVHIVDGGYDVSGSFKYYLSTNGTAGNMCVIKTAGAVGQFAEGPPVDSKAPEGLTGKFAKSWEDEDPAGRWVLVTQTAMAGLTNPERVFCGTLW